MKSNHTAFDSLIRRASREASSTPAPEVWAGIEAALPARTMPLWGKALIALGSAAAVGLLLWLALPVMESHPGHAPLADAPATPVQPLPLPSTPLPQSVPPVQIDQHTPGPQTQATVLIEEPKEQLQRKEIVREEGMVQPSPLEAVAVEAVPAPTQNRLSVISCSVREPSLAEALALRTALLPIELENIPAEDSPKNRKTRKGKQKGHFKIRMPVSAKHARRQMGRDFSLQIGPEAQVSRRFFGSLSGIPGIWLPFHLDGGLRIEMALSPHVRLTTGARFSNSESLYFAQNVSTIQGTNFEGLFQEFGVPFELASLNRINIFRLNYRRFEVPLGAKFVFPPARVRGWRPFGEVQAVFAQSNIPVVKVEARATDGGTLVYSGVAQNYGVDPAVQLIGSLTLGVEKQLFSRVNAQMALMGAYGDRYNQYAGIQLSLLFMSKRGYFGELKNQFRSI